MTICVDRVHCMGDTEKRLTIERNNRITINLVDPFLSAVAFTPDFAAMVLRGDPEYWYDTTTGRQIERPENHDIASEVLLLDVIPGASDVRRTDTETQRFLQEVVRAERHAVVEPWDDEKRRDMVRKLLAQTPGRYTSENELAGLLVLFASWQGPVAEKTFQEVQAALAAWPAEHRKLPHWLDELDWRVPDLRWRFFQSSDIRIEQGDLLEQVRSLVKADYLPRVDTLTVSGPIGTEGAELLAGWPGLAGVEHLQLRGCALGDAGVSALAASPHLGVFESVEMTRCGIGDAGAVALSRVIELPKKGELNLYGNEIGDEGAMAFAARARSSRPFRHLNLAGNRIGPEGQRDLYHAKYRDPTTAQGGPCVLLHDQRPS
ncbi:MAG: hypothetical protein JW797_17460 [Bradymonadales bacterium]|nr:hypothetical protein [Bradymonadales bacterium]